MTHQQTDNVASGVLWAHLNLFCARRGSPGNASVNYRTGSSNEIHSIPCLTLRSHNITNTPFSPTSCQNAGDR
jgi:hypothetical protein